MPTRRFLLNHDGPIDYLTCCYCQTDFLLETDATGQLRCPRCGSSPVMAGLLRAAGRVQATIKGWITRESQCP